MIAAALGGATQLAAIVIVHTQSPSVATLRERAGLLLLIAFLCSFVFIRTSARLSRSPKVPWWPGSVSSGGVHLHHLVWGIVLVLLCGFLAFVVPQQSPYTEIIAVLFGIGAGFTLDEFALWIYLDDVYWSERGRDSVDAVIIATIIASMVVFGFVPFDGDTGSPWAVTLAVGVNIVFVVLTMLKGKIKLGVLAFFILPVGIVGAIRLATPHSPWARWFYKPASGRMGRAVARHARHEVRRDRWFDRIAGAPSKPARAVKAARAARAEKAARVAKAAEIAAAADSPAAPESRAGAAAAGDPGAGARAAAAGDPGAGARAAATGDPDAERAAPAGTDLQRAGD